MSKHIISCFAISTLLFCFMNAYGQRLSKKGYKYQKKSDRQYARYQGGKIRSGRYIVGQDAHYMQVGASLNVMNYYGDISPTSSSFLSTNFSNTTLGVGITVSGTIYPGIFLRLDYNRGEIKGDDFSSSNPEGDTNNRGRYSRNLQFKNTINELALGVEFHYPINRRGVMGRFPFSAYVFVGAAVFHHAPKALAPANDLSGKPLPQAGQWVDLRSLGTEGQYLPDSKVKPYSEFALAIPIGVGIKARVVHQFDVSLELGFRKLFTDYLDDISGEYPDLSKFSDPLARALSNRSAEETDVLTGRKRNEKILSELRTIPGGYRVGPDYNNGGGGIRGGSRSQDFYTVTQIRIAYLFAIRKRSGKRR